MYRDPKKVEFSANVCVGCMIGIVVLSLVAFFLQPAQPATANTLSLDEALQQAPVTWIFNDTCVPKHKGHCQKSFFDVRFPALKGIKANLKLTTSHNGKTEEHKPLTKQVTKTYRAPTILGDGTGKIGYDLLMIFDLGIGKHNAELTLNYQGQQKIFKKTFETTLIQPRPRKATRAFF